MSDRIRIDPGSRMPLDPVPDPGEGEPLPTSPHPPSAYVELGMRSNYSFLQAASPPEALVEKARELGYDAVSLTDRDGFYGMVRALERCRRLSVRLIVGAELTVSESGVHGPYRTVRVHVANPDGYRQLCRLLTRSHALHPKGKPRKKVLGIPRNLYAGLPYAELFAAGVATRGSGGLWVMAGHEPRISPSSAISGDDERFLRGLRGAFGERASVSVHLHKDGWDRRRVTWAKDAEARFGLPGVAIGHVLYAEREGKTLYDVLHCIGEGTTLDEAGRRLSPNAEARLKSPAEMARAFRDHPAWIARTRAIADACTFDLGSIKYKFPCELEDPAYPGETPDEAIRRLTYEGARAHHQAKTTEALPADVQKQIEAELDPHQPGWGWRRSSSASAFDHRDGAEPRTSSARVAWQRGQQRRLLLRSANHCGRSGPIEPAFRAIPLRRTERTARHRRRLRARATRGGHPGHLCEVRPRSVRPW